MSEPTDNPIVTPCEHTYGLWGEASLRMVNSSSGVSTARVQSHRCTKCGFVEDRLIICPTANS